MLFRVTLAEPGSIRRRMRLYRRDISGGQVSSVATGKEQTRQARAEIAATVGVWNSDAGRSELAEIHARAARK